MKPMEPPPDPPLPPEFLQLYIPTSAKGKLLKDPTFGHGSFLVKKSDSLRNLVIICIRVY